MMPKPPFGAQLVEREADLGRRVAAAGQPRCQEGFFDVAVVAVRSVAKIAIAKLVAEESDDAILGRPLGLADGAHREMARLHLAGGIAVVAVTDSDLSPLARVARSTLEALGR